jgi:hypothetical protein
MTRLHYLIPLLTLALQPSARSAESDGARDPMAYALSFLTQLTDIDFQSRESLFATEILIEKGQLSRAAGCARQIQDYRRGIALAKTAAAFARQGDAERAAALLTEPAITSAPRTHDWQDTTIRAEIAIAKAALGRDEEVVQALAGFDDPPTLCQARAGVALERARRGAAYEDPIFDERPGEAKSQRDFFPERIEAARALLRIAGIKLGKATPAGPDTQREVARLAERAEEIIRAYRLIAGDELLEIGLLWRRLGEDKRSAETLAAAFRQMPVGVEMNSWTPGSFARLTTVYWEAGRKEEVAKMFAGVRTGIARQHRFYHPAALSQLAEAQFATGAKDEAIVTWLEAIATTRDQNGAVESYLGCVQIAFSLSRCFSEMPEPISTVFAPLLTPPPTPQPVAPAR